MDQLISELLNKTRVPTAKLGWKKEGLLHHDIMMTRKNILFLLYGAQIKAQSRHSHTKVRNSANIMLSLVQKDMKTA